MADPVLVDINVPQFQENAVNAAPDFLFGTMTIQDPDDDFNGGTLVISGLLPEEVITFLNFGTGPGEPSFNAGTGEVSFGGVVYGVLTGGSGGADLVITFNAAADSAIVSMVLMNLMYQNTSDAPTQDRALTLTVTDAAGHSTSVVTEPGWELVGAADPLAGLPYIDARLVPAFTDLDGDGDLDMAVGTYNGDVRYYENTGSSTAAVFEERTGGDNPFDGLDVGYTAIQRFADVDGDGDMDLVSGSSGGEFHYFRNDGAAGFTELSGTENPFADMTTDYAGAVALGDLEATAIWMRSSPGSTVIRCTTATTARRPPRSMSSPARSTGPTSRPARRRISSMIWTATAISTSSPPTALVMTSATSRTPERRPFRASLSAPGPTTRSTASTPSTPPRRRSPTWMAMASTS